MRKQDIQYSPSFLILFSLRQVKEDFQLLHLDHSRRCFFHTYMSPITWTYLVFILIDSMTCWYISIVSIDWIVKKSNWA